MANSVSIKLFGTFTLRISGGGPVSLPLKSRALIAFLALQEGRPVRRDAISELLWPGRPEKQARNSLKQELYVLRRDGCAGREVVVTENDAVLLRADKVDCDLHALRALLRDRNSSWHAIAALYNSPLLHDFPAVSPDFDHQVARHQRVLEAEVLDVSIRLANEAASAGDLAHCIEIAEWMHVVDPLREDTHRRLIQAYADAGRRSDAMRIYTGAKQLLRREMDVAPSAETEALVAQLRIISSPTSHSVTTRPTVPLVPNHVSPPRIAVLPLRQSTDQPLASHLSDGIVADIITQLSGLRELSVISHGSTFNLRDPGMDSGEVGRRLNARYLVIGRIRHVGDRLRLTTELTDAEQHQIIYSHTDTVDAALTFDDQDRMVAGLVNRMVPQVHENELRRIRGKRPDVLSIYDKVLVVRERLLLLDRGGFAEAKTLLDDIMREDPGYGEAYALAADWHGLMIGEGWSLNRSADMAAVEHLSKQALRLDNANLRALVAYAYRRSSNHRDHGGAIRMFDHALDVAPSLANAWALSAISFAYAGDAAEAVRRATRALELSPYDRECYKFYHALCVAYYTSGDYEQAVEWGKRALAERTVWRGARGFTSAALAALGRLREAREIVAEITASAPTRRISAVLGDLAYQDPNRRRRYGEHLAAAGFPE